MKNRRILSVIFCLLLAVGLWLPQEVKAINVWGDWFDRTVGQKGFDDVGFGRKDPRTIVANVINIGLGLLGVLAILLILYAGFVWMTASGNPEKIEIAKKILTSASIGLLIVLSAWAISIYILSRLWLATGSQGGGVEGFPCTPDGITTACGCGGERVCSGGQWGVCVGSDCSGSGGQRTPCDANALTPECDADNTACAPDGYCNPADCYCTSRGGYGDACDKDTSNSTCEIDNDLCQEYLTCDTDKCTCLGEPIIESVSPIGGFCDGSINTNCSSNADCSSFTPNTCNLNSANGAEGNLVTINGRYFLPYQPGVSQVLFWDGSDFTLEASLAVTVNSNCSDSWSDSQIVVVVPQGAKEGGVKVVAPNGSDSTNNNRGPAINDFIVNTLKRPGLCDLNPTSGRLDTLLTYSGLGLSGVEAYFGSLSQNIKANNSSFLAVDSGTAQSPNVRAGKTTTFVGLADGPFSNFLQFTQEAEENKAPIIISFEPAGGAEGQYVTIRGSGFGNQRQDSRVYFDNVEANYEFPSVCTQSVWRDSEIIVKVPKDLPDGDRKLIVEVNRLRAEAPNNFKADKKARLLPGLCKIDPLYGQINDEISFWGEYFGSKDNNSQLNFFQDRFRKIGPKICLGGDKDGDACILDNDCSGGNCQEEIIAWGEDRSSKDKAKADLATTKVPQETITGPVKVVKGAPALFSNSINFTVGQCTQDSQCGGTNVCCPVGTPVAGRCKENMSECYGSIDSCVYEWEFNTGSKNSCSKDRPNACQDGSCCRSACVLDSATNLTTCLDNVSCSGYNGNQCFDTILCPNSPGNCSFNNSVKTIGASCNCDLLGCPNCQYNEELNRCLSPASCSLKESLVVDGRKLERYCDKYNNVARWHINTNQTCPKGFTPTFQGSRVCVDLASSCELCDKNLSCVSVGGFGRCASVQPVCPNNFSCQDQVCTRDSGLCECCCDKQQNKDDKTNPACCAPLTCENECGAGGNFGYCSGCANVGETQEEHDAACNCDGHSGKYCDASLPGGACRDCSQIGDVTACGSHAACCADFKQGNICKGVLDSKFMEGNIGYCAYYGCGDNCLGASKNDAYNSQADCLDNCPLSCDADTKQPGCQKDKCPDDKPICNDKCECEADNINVEKSCATDAGACSLLCDRPYNCRGELGCEGSDCAGQADELTCLCCCNPNNKGIDSKASDFDKCKAIGTGKLFCQENMGECTGNTRGLCCGCKADEDCGDPETIGCGGDTCCHNRPEVETVVPAINSEDVCRNALIRVGFNQKMDTTSFAGNVIVVGDFGSELCPDDSTLLAGLGKQAQPSSFFVRVWQKFKKLISVVLPLVPDKEASAADSHNFCAFSGKTSGAPYFDVREEKTYADFLLTQALSANTKYYVIVKGDDGLNNRSGVLDINKIGLREVNNSDISIFNGITYPNAYIWSFSTGSDICFLDEVSVNPNQYLFQKPNDSHPFFADAITTNGSIIVPLPIYNWDWSWRSDNSSVASVQAKTKPEDYKATVSSGSKRDAETFVYARAAITHDEVSPISTVGKYKEGRARIIVFVCENPWPAVQDPTNWPFKWQDEAGNCTICTDPVTQKPKPCSNADCLDNHFEFYYCRDKSAKGTKDDLPSLTLEPPIRGRYKYQSSSLWVDVLKDFYFFRIALPNEPADLKVELTDFKKAGEVRVSWTTQRDLSYKIYYGTQSGNYNDYVDAGTKDSVIVGGLKNGQDYYFVLTATNLQKAESAYSNEVKIRVEDKIPPSQVANVKAKIVKTANDIRINLNWDKDTTEAVKYIIEYGPNPDSAVSVNLGSVYTYSIGKLDNLAVQDYYLKIIAQDAYNNKSDAVEMLCAKGCADNCDCQPR